MNTTTTTIHPEATEARIEELANREPGQFIDVEEFEALNGSEQNEIIERLKERGRTFFKRDGMLIVMQAEDISAPVSFGHFQTYEFGICHEEPRIGGTGNVYFTVHNVDSREEAWETLKVFIKGLRELPLNMDSFSSSDKA